MDGPAVGAQPAPHNRQAVGCVSVRFGRLGRAGIHCDVRQYVGSSLSAATAAYFVIDVLARCMTSAWLQCGCMGNGAWVTAGARHRLYVGPAR